VIREAIVTTLAADGGAHITPLGFREEAGRVVLAPFVPSVTLENLRRAGVAVLNFTDDVRVFAGCLTGRRHWPLLKKIRKKSLKDQKRRRKKVQ